MIFPLTPTGNAALYDSIGAAAYQTEYENFPVQLEYLDALQNDYLPSNARVLELGSGTGKPNAAFLTSRGHSFTGVEISPSMHDLATEQVPAARFVKADMLSYEEADWDGSFDAILVAYSLFSTPLEDIRMLMRKCERFLKPGGVLVLVSTLYEDMVKNRGQVEGAERFRAGEAVLTWMGRQLFSTVLVRDDWVEALEGAGLKIVMEKSRECVTSVTKRKETSTFFIAQKPEKVR